jgi:hypothetical protein
MLLVRTTYSAPTLESPQKPSAAHQAANALAPPNLHVPGIHTAVCPCLFVSPAARWLPDTSSQQVSTTRKSANDVGNPFVIHSLGVKSVPSTLILKPHLMLYISLSLPLVVCTSRCLCLSLSLPLSLYNSVPVSHASPRHHTSAPPQRFRQNLRMRDTLPVCEPECQHARQSARV